MTAIQPALVFIMYELFVKNNLFMRRKLDRSECRKPDKLDELTVKQCLL